MHIYETPFYYIDYCLAQTAALQFLLASQKDYDGACNGIVGKGMTGLVGHHVHVCGGPVEVRQNKRLMIGHEAGAVAAAPGPC